LDPVLLILGCGLGGAAAAREARRLLPPQFRVIVIDREQDGSYPPSYLSVMTGERRPESIRRSRTRLARHGIEFVPAEVWHIDVANRYVRAGSREFRYDYLLLALGSEPALDTRPGLLESAHAFSSLEGAERLAATLRYFSGGQILILVTGLPIKSPTLPYEAAMLLEHLFHERHMRQKVEIAVYTPEVRPIADAGLEGSETLMGLLAHKGIELEVQKHLLSVDSAHHEAVFSDGNRVSFQLLIAVPEQRAPAVVREAGLLDADGWVEVNPASMETRFERVYAVGDLVKLETAAGERLPKAGDFAAAQGKVAAQQIAYRAGGGAMPDSFDGRGRWFLETGGGAAAVIEGNFLDGGRHVTLKPPSIAWHWLNRAIERRWLIRAY
jgi:sulfide:quinone oxidoreductase